MESKPERSAIRIIVPGMYEQLSRYNVTVTVSRDQDGELPDPVAFAVAADEAAWHKSASIVTVHAPDRHAAVAVARAVVSDALRYLAVARAARAESQAPPPSAA